MISHKKIWCAIDKIAKDANLSPSGLAKKAGLDPTSFNKSKRVGNGGKLRWPSTESLYKILKVLNKDLSYFSSLAEPNSFSDINIIANINGNNSGFYENDTDNEWEKIAFPRSFPNGTIAIRVKGYDLEPIYRKNDILIISKNEKALTEDERVAIKTKDNKIIIKAFVEQNKSKITVKSICDKENLEHLDKSNIDWIGKIKWVSQ
ncbi:MAG: helix-turn-helix transcriptional regulator [Alphaproteobacteria bacterium]|jgi:phage repressor protein C with HTH and peptisase S24 domain|nr:helix-turn-helix transcriptional regulator [Alphaproteobacteria bacterium]